MNTSYIFSLTGPQNPAVLNFQRQPGVVSGTPSTVFRNS